MIRQVIKSLSGDTTPAHSGVGNGRTVYR